MTAQELVSRIWRIGLMDPVAVRMENAVALVEADRIAWRKDVVQAMVAERQAVVDRIVNGLRTEFFDPDSVVAKAFLEKVRGWGDDVE